MLQQKIDTVVVGPRCRTPGEAAGGPRTDGGFYRSMQHQLEVLRAGVSKAKFVRER